MMIGICIHYHTKIDETWISNITIKKGGNELTSSFVNLFPLKVCDIVNHITYSKHYAHKLYRPNSDVKMFACGIKWTISGVTLIC